MGAPLRPDQIEAIAKHYAETANHCETARRVGVSEGTVRGVLKRLRSATRYELHARAIDNGLRAGRKALALAIQQGPQRLAEAEDPKGFSFVVQALARAVETLQSLDEHRGKRLSGRLQREKARAEIAALKRTDAGTGDIQLIVRVQPDPTGDRTPMDPDAAPGADLPPS